MAVLDVLTVGRVEVGVYPLQSGSVLPDVTSFGTYLGDSVRRALEPAAAPAVRRGSARRARPSARP